MDLTALFVFSGTENKAPFAEAFALTPTTGSSREFIEYLGDAWHEDTSTAVYKGEAILALIEQIKKDLHVGICGADYALNDFIEDGPSLIGDGVELYICCI